MTIDEAIRRLKSMVKVREDTGLNYDLSHLKLGIEALKHIKRGRTCRGNYVDNPLPGEKEA